MLNKLEDSDWGFVVYAPKTFKKAVIPRENHRSRNSRITDPELV